MRILSVTLLLLTFSIAGAQKILTIEDAVNLALKNNFNILVSRNEADILKIKNTPGNAGMLPEINLTGSGRYELNDVHQGYADGTENEYPDFSGTSVSAGAELSWTLFDGGKMFVTKAKLNEIESLGEIQFKDRVLQTLYEVIASYYNIVKQKQQLAFISEVINFNQERVIIAQTGFNAGSLIKSDLLQAKIDLNVALENSINQQFIIESEMKNLGVLLGQNSETEYDISDSIPLEYSFSKDDILQRLEYSNTSILVLKKQVDIARLNLKEFSRSFLPTINLQAGYSFSFNNNSDGTLLQSRSFGPLVGGTVLIPLYHSGENKRLVSTARIQLQSAEYFLQETKLRVNTQVRNAITDYENQRQLLEIEEENNSLTRENLEISLNRLKLGQTTSLEVHQAQEDFVQSCTRLVNFKYDLKISETRLKQLIASL
jgi:outer membrane protein